MARQNRTNKQADATAEAPTTEEGTVTTEPTTSPEAPAEGTTTEAAEAPINLDAFIASVNENLTEADTETGAMPEAAIAKVNEQYRALDGQKPKNAARNYLDEQMMKAVGELNAPLARSYSDLKVNLSAGGGSSTPKAPADPVAAFVQRLATLSLAVQIVNGQRPETERDIDAEVEKLVSESADSVTAYQTWLDNEAEDKGDAPEVSRVVSAAFKAAQGKGTGGGGSRAASTGPRGDIGKHIASAFAEVESGTFLTVAEIAKHKSADYPDAPPSQGAVSARLFPKSGKCTVEGIVPVDKQELDGKNPKGARKA